MTGGGKSSKGTGRKSRSGKMCESFVETDRSRWSAEALPLLAQRDYKGPTSLLISSAADSPAKTLASLDGEPDLPETEVDCSSSSPESSENSSPASYSSRTFQACFLPIKDLISLSSSIRWTNSGTVWRGAFSIASSSESPRDAAECSLSDILVPHAHPKYSLSPKAAAGILRRAERRGKALPTHLEAALVALMNTPAQPTSPSPCALTDGEEVTATETRAMSSPSVRTSEPKSGSLPTADNSQAAAESQGKDTPQSVRRLTPTEEEPNP